MSPWAILACAVLLSTPAAAEVILFAAGSDQISSVGVLDMAQDLRGSSYFATDNGLSVYDGAWKVSHPDYWNPGQGILSDHILSIEFDAGGNLWMGFPGGVQRMEGSRYVTIRDQQLLKSLDIHGLIRVGRDMWIAAGNSGLHRYRDGAWEWFQPHGSGGLGCNYVKFMAVDPAEGWLYVSCNEGVFVLDPADEPAVFSPVPVPGFTPGTVRGIRSDPFGGVYIFNSSAILHHTAPDQWKTVVLSETLTPGIEINDLVVDPDRSLWIATNNGIYAWRDGRIREHLDSQSIRNNAVKRIFIDREDRVWFVTPENVGFSTIIRKAAERGSPIPITTFQLPTPVPLPSTDITAPPTITPDIAMEVRPDVTAPAVGPAGPLDSILAALSSFIARFFPG